MSVPNINDPYFIKQHKEEIMEQIMIDYGRDILKLSYSYVRNRTIAEDLTQEVFLKCYEKIDTYHGDSKLKTWLYSIATNHCSDYLRSAHYRYSILTDKIAKITKGKNLSPEESMLIKDEQNHLANLVFHLPLKYREVIFLFYFEDLSINEISNLIGLNPNTVKSRLSRAKALLKIRLERGDVK